MIDIKIPKGFMNCRITVNNYLITDTNDSSNWGKIKIKLPKPTYKWSIHSYKEKDGQQYVVLVDLIPRGK